MGVTFDGYDEFERKLEEAPDELRHVGKKWCDKMLVFLYNEASKNTPVDTGTLKRNWHVEKSEWNGGSCYGKVSNHTEYARHVEYGHRIKRNGKYVGYVDGQHFFRNAKRRLRDARPEMLEKMRAEMKKKVNK